MRCIQYTHKDGTTKKALFADHADWKDALRPIAVDGTCVEVPYVPVAIPVVVDPLAAKVAALEEKVSALEKAKGYTPPG